ncbi:MAG: TonB-dependent receptor [Saprospiraceae bacterium]
MNKLFKIKMKSFLFLIAGLFVSGTMVSQTVTGTVVDAKTGEALIGASVFVQNTSRGTITDIDGSYSIEAASTDVLVISFVGYSNIEEVVGNRTVVDIILSQGLLVDEVVVTGYQTQTRGNITGSVSSVDMDEAVKAPMTNAAQALQGRVSGVTVVNSGSPGSAPKINIRGFGTSNNTDPLYIIDGVQTNDATVLNSINPSDIDQMNVLKDGAAAIYGARASNGVVIITTKSGGYNMDKAEFSVDLYTGVSNMINTPKLLNAQQHGDMIFESLRNVGESPNHVQYGNGSSAVVPSTLNGTGIPATANVNPNGTDWIDAISQSGKVLNASISLQNGTATGKYFMSASFLNQEGVQIHTGYKRGNTRLNSEFKVADRLRIGQHVNVTYSQGSNPEVRNGIVPGVGSGVNQINSALRMNPLVPVFDADGNFSGGYNNANELGNTPSPVAVLSRGQNDYRKDFRLLGDVYAEIDLTDELSAKTVISGSVASLTSRAFNALDPEAAESISTNTLTEGSNSLNSWTWTNTLNYRKEFGNHDLNVLLGVEALEEKAKGQGISRTGYLFETPEFYLLGNGSGTPLVTFAHDRTSTLFSYFGSANYAFDRKYFVTATVRRDKSSRFQGDNKADIFPSISVGWALSRENFFSTDGIISRAKLKASYGELGNQSLPANNPTINISGLSEIYANYAFNGGALSTGAILSSVGNPNLRWETSKSTNIGLDLGLFNEALSLSVEWFNIKTKDLIVRDNTLIPTTGPDASPPLVNLGSVKNTGVDLSLGYNKSTNSGLNYNVSAHFSSYKNEVTEWINAFQTGVSTFRNGAITRTEEGQPISYFYGRVVEGVFASESEVSSSADQNFVSAADGVGRFKYKDLNGDNVINDLDREFIGSPHPDFTYGIHIGADIKGLDISAFFQGSQGNEVYNYEKIFTDFPTFFNVNRSVRVLDSWSSSNTGASLPALQNSISNSETNPSSFFVEDGSYLRLKNLQIGYTLPKSASDKLGMSSLRLYIQGTNLITLTGYEGLDPEVTSNRNNLTLGVDFNTYPVSRILTFGTNIKF